MSFVLFENLEEGVLWLGRNALHTALPALLVSWFCWQRWGSARLRFALAALVLAKLMLPAWPGWSWQISVPDWAAPAGSDQPAGLAGETVDSASLFFFSASPATPTLPWWVIVWLVGVLILLAWWIAGHIQVRHWITRHRQTSPTWLTQILDEECQRLQVTIMPELCVLRGWPQAAVHGWWRPQVLVPESWLSRLTENEWRGVLRHELAHVRRHDVLWSALAFAVAALHWFHPIGWLALRRLRAEAELLCDEAALAGRNESHRRDYGHVLIRLIEPFTPAPPQPVAAFARHRTEIQHRIQMIAQPHATPTWSRVAAWLVVPTLSLSLITAGESEGSKNSSEREKDTGRPRDGEVRKEGQRDGDRPREGPRDGDRPREGAREGDRPREGPRDGDRPREGAREGDRPREGAREGDRPREGMKESESARRSSEGGESTRKESPTISKAPALVIQLNADGAVVNSEGRVIPDNEVKERIGQIARGNPGQEILLRGEKDTRYESLTRVLNLLKDLDVKPTLGL